jgi:outer membrane scaffolding protein for murein synthesis (MipA/OmpV family)
MHDFMHCGNGGIYNEHAKNSKNKPILPLFTLFDVYINNMYLRFLIAGFVFLDSDNIF